MKKSKRRQSSILSASSRRQFAAAFAAMSIIPLLTLVYLLVTYVHLDESVPTDVLVVLAINLVLSLSGMFMLGKILRALLRLRNYMERSNADRPPGDLGEAGAEIGLIASAAEAMTRELDVERKWLNDMSVALERESRQHAADTARHNDMLSHVLEACPSGMLIIDSTGRITHANALAADIFGLPLRELVGRSHAAKDWHAATEDGELLADDDLPFSVARDKGGHVHGSVFSILRPDGERIAISTDVLPLFDQSADFQGAVMLIEDLSEEGSAPTPKLRMKMK